MRRERQGKTWVECGVSILTRPEGRMRLLGRFAEFGRFGFQSSPDPKAGCDRSQRMKGHYDQLVSILTRPEGRMRHARVTPVAKARGFNPHPTRRPDATPHTRQLLRPDAGFNPHPTRRPDATSTHAAIPSASLRFNPHPTRRPDATIVQPPNVDLGVFQSSPDPKAGCDDDLGRVTMPRRKFQSSPDPKAGCDLRLLDRCAQ